MPRRGTIIICESDLTPVPDTSDCPNNDRHTPAPTGYVAWHEWAAKMVRTNHRQRRCTGCGLLKVWS